MIKKQKDDLVYRQSVLDAILGDGPPEPHYPSWYIDKIKSVPSVNLEKGEDQDDQINDDWVIDTDPWNFILKKDLHRKKTRDGEEKDAYRSVGYFRSVSEAFERLGEEIIRERLNVPEIGLEQAVCILRECRDEIHALRKVIEEGLK